MKKIRTHPLWILLGLFGLISLTACGGGGGGSSAAVSQQETGTVVLFVKDGPADEYDEINITFNKIALLPYDEEGEPVVLFKSEEGKEIDLLQYRDDPFLFTVHNDIPTGKYAKIRLWVSKIEPLGGPCEKFEVKLPSGKIDLNPRDGFEVAASRALAIELDVDLDKSINLHKAGKSGKCIFRPVIFVDIYERPSIMPKCPRIIQGTIREILKEVQDTVEVVTGFTMALDSENGTENLLTVMTGAAVVIDATGGAAELTEDEAVKVRGWLNDDGSVAAYLVVVGAADVVQGISTRGFENGNNTFVMLPKDDLETLVVLVDDTTRVLMNCDDQVGPDAIQENMDVMVIGQMETEDPFRFKAVAVLLRPLKIVGRLTSIDPVEENDQVIGHDLIVDTDPDGIETLVNIFMPKGVYPHLKGDGIIPLEALQDLLACPKDLFVEIKLDPVDATFAADVAVLPYEVSGAVMDDDDPGDRMLPVLIDGQVEPVMVHIRSYATLLVIDPDDGSLEPIGFSEIQAGDTVTSYGLEVCVEGGEPEGQIAYIVVVEKAETPPVSP